MFGVVNVTTFQKLNEQTRRAYRPLKVTRKTRVSSETNG